MLKPKEIAEISLALWYLPLPQLVQVSELVFRLKKEHGYDEPIDDSDEWTEEDMREVREASLRRWDELEGEGWDQEEGEGSEAGPGGDVKG
jgi:hypothetical protein